MSQFAASIPYTTVPGPFRNEMAKYLKEQLLSHSKPRTSRMEHCLPKPSQGCALPVSEIENF